MLRALEAHNVGSREGLPEVVVLVVCCCHLGGQLKWNTLVTLTFVANCPRRPFSTQLQISLCEQYRLVAARCFKTMIGRRKERDA